MRTLWRWCRDRSVVPALLVVPDWHGRWPLTASPAFVDWVRGCAASGAEIFLHGERHDEVGLPRGWGDSLRAWGKTAREGEFLTLDERAARDRIERGLALLRTLGLSPIGFVPPAWLARWRACARAVSAAGLRYSEDDHAILVHDRPIGGPVDGAPVRRLPSPVVRWSGRTPVRAHGSAIVARARYRVQRRARYVRIALHPSDLDHPTTARSAAAELDRWLKDRPPSRYGEL